MGRKVQNQPEAEKKTNKDKVIDIRLGIFFDGTSNNKLNIFEYRNPEQYQSRWTKKYHEFKRWTSISYKSDFSNVAKLSDFYQQEKKDNEYFGAIYIEGIATAPREKDTDPGGFDDYMAAATGMGELGINGKVEHACQKIIEKIGGILAKNENKGVTGIKTLKLDVFGFSRGAAAARRFVSCIEKPSGERIRHRGRYPSYYDVCLCDVLKKKGKSLPPVNRIQPCFLGLFDTVSSYGLNFKDDVKELTLGVSKPEMVVQLVAADEYRKNFALTRIKTANGKSKELILPGEHCDIGGSHNDGVQEKTILKQEKTIVHHNMVQPLPAIYNGYKTLEQLLEEGWINSKDEKIRVVSNKYSVIPLLLMHSYLKMRFNQDILKENRIISELAEIKKRIDRIEQYPLYRFISTIPEQMEPLFQKDDTDFILLKNIRHHYLHLSASGGLVNSPAKNNIRLIIDDSK
ncbi:phospholipase effector Tle1 domain-containing protein [Porphyromonas macacae]|uniref:phospholipase effector Tle1 domain-containing protein n=1 Tax=Porphyromonas macacae TaxID=28115 RepID=UPI0024AE019D|nr:DUF2235 domain-containing protein [Porphyromonas macacae]